MPEIGSIPVNTPVYSEYKQPQNKKTGAINSEQLYETTGEKKNEPGVKYLKAKMPTKTQAKKLTDLAKEWFNNYTKRPHRYNPDKIENGIETAYGFLTDPRPSKEKSQNINLSV